MSRSLTWQERSDRIKRYFYRHQYLGRARISDERRAFLHGVMAAFEQRGLFYSGRDTDTYLRGASCARRRMFGGCGCGYHISHAPYCPTRSGVRGGR